MASVPRIRAKNEFCRKRENFKNICKKHLTFFGNIYIIGNVPRETELTKPHIPGKRTSLKLPYRKVFLVAEKLRKRKILCQKNFPKKYRKKVKKHLKNA